MNENIPAEEVAEGKNKTSEEGKEEGEGHLMKVHTSSPEPLI